ncbi:MAG TPA: hypothetical protein ENF23_07575 [Methanosarcinales archaeon]|nr:MAG: hypothetical protein DRO03_07035 [Methanosarcinales archaeon]HDN66126.1 hypothetical protein [Methanosarcinales archaeon]
MKTESEHSSEEILQVRSIYPSGCRFHTRCPRREEICMIAKPKLVEIEGKHHAACHFI